MLRLFKGAHRKPAGLAGAGQPTSAPCTVSTCASTTTWECAYTDSTGATCATHWCADHVLTVEGTPFCRRHASVASLLLTRVGTLVEMPVPLVSDRSLPLLLRLAAQVDARAVQLLHHLYRDRREVLVAPHADIREYRSQGRMMGWQAIWSATSRTGYLTQVSLRTSLDDPPRVAVCRDGMMVREGVLEWVRMREEDRWNGPGDGEFLGELFNALVSSFTSEGVA